MPDEAPVQRCGKYFVFDNEDVISCGYTGHLAFSSSIAPALADGSGTMQGSAFSRCVPSPGTETARNAFVSRRRYGKVTSRIPAMYTVAFGTACDFAMRYAAAPSRSSRRELGRRSPLGNIT